MKLTWAIRLLAALGAVGLTITVVNANDGAMTFRATMSGFHEVAPILTNGSGTFHATIKGNSMTYTETFSDLSAPVTQSHIHFAEKGVNGSVFVFLCSNVGGPAGTPACPAGGGTVTRTVTAGDVLGVANQNIPAGDFAALLRILRSGDAYVNVHTMKFPAGEIRGQVRIGDD
ncbi:MAG TPA: CHRD domain-containing protein [Candidatus Dormibacteraeota bacterium]|nr:CHRD domain-containing protein [Candidatus Dormibacteraeota bacterium]